MCESVSCESEKSQAHTPHERPSANTMLTTWLCTQCNTRNLQLQAATEKRCVECDRAPNKKVKSKSKLNGLPLDLIFEAVRFLSVRAATRLLITSHDMHGAITNDAFICERWFSNLVTTNHPSLLHLSHPSLDTSMKKLFAYVKCCTAAPTTSDAIEHPDLSQVLVHCQVYTNVSETVDDTVTCETCTLVNPFGASNCAACHQQIDYTNIGTEDVLLQTVSVLDETDMHFAYPPIAASVANRVQAMFDEEMLWHPNISLRLCLFDTKSCRTFAQYEGFMEDVDEGYNIQFSLEELTLRSSLTPHLRTLMNANSLCFWGDIDFNAGATNGHLFLHGEDDEVEAALEVLYLFSKSIDWSEVLRVPSSVSLSLASSLTSGQLPFVSQSSMVEAGRTALFALPNLPVNPQVENIRKAKISLSKMLDEDVSFVICVHDYSSHLSIPGSAIFHSELVASFDEDKKALIFSFPELFDDSFLSMNAFNQLIEIIAVNSQTGRMCQLVKYTVENRNESASVHNIATSLLGSVLVESCNCELTCYLTFEKQDDECQLKYSVLIEGSPQDASIMNAFLHMSFDEGGVLM